MHQNRAIYSIVVLFILVMIVSLSGCSDDSDATKYTANTTLTSTSLSSRNALDRNLLAATCPTGKSCVTPSNLEGRVYYGGLMVGGNNGVSGVSITTVGATDAVLLRPDQGKGGTLTFNVGTTTDLSGNYYCCNEEQYPGDSDATVTRLEFGFDYLDTTFTVPSTAGSAIASKSYTIRVVYATDTTLSDVVSGSEVTAQQGDKLVKIPDSDTFVFCDSTDCTATTRPSSPLQDSNVTNYTQPGDGNQNYVSFAVALSSAITFTKAEAEQGNWRFSVDFSLTNAAIFNHTDWTSVASVNSLVNHFQLIGDPGDSNTSITVTVTKTKIS